MENQKYPISLESFSEVWGGSMCIYIDYNKVDNENAN